MVYMGHKLKPAGSFFIDTEPRCLYLYPTEFNYVYGFRKRKKNRIDIFSFCINGNPLPAPTPQKKRLASLPEANELHYVSVAHGYLKIFLHKNRDKN